MELINPIMKYSKRPTLLMAHISDLHFGVIDPKVQYEILQEQFLSKIQQLQLDIISIDGDIFDQKMMSTNPAIAYALTFVDNIVCYARRNNITVVIIKGTAQHDSEQYSLFYKYLYDASVDVRIIEQTQFIYVKGAKILCIPEEYGKGSQYYSKFLFESGMYDSVFMHGAVVGSIYGCDKEDLDNPRNPVFSIDSFVHCLGPIISGHVHVAGCYGGYIYYNGSPIRWSYGEEAKKGFCIVLYDLETKWHYTHFEEIKSFRYDTVNLDRMLQDDPRNVIAYIKSLQAQGIDHIRVEFSEYNENVNVIDSYFRNNSTVKIKAEKPATAVLRTELQESNQRLTEYNYILDPALSEYDKLAQYINQQVGYAYVTAEEIIKLMEDEM